MKGSEYFRIQTEASVWTRQNVESQALAEDSILEFRKFAPEQHNVLEIGCGDGYALDVLANNRYKQVMGCDINFSKLQIACSFGNIVSMQDVHSLGFQSAVFDAVYCTHTLEHTHNGYHAVQEIFRILRPGGLLFVIVPDHAYYYGETFVEPDEVIPIEQRDLGIFEDILFERHGFRADSPRNQFPFTMKTLLAVILESGFELQYTARVDRYGTELWAIATKPRDDVEVVSPLIKRVWQNISIVDNLKSKIYQLISPFKNK